MLGIAIELAESKPDVDPRYINFVACSTRCWPCRTSPTIRNAAAEKVLEAIQRPWIEELD